MTTRDYFKEQRIKNEEKRQKEIRELELLEREIVALVEDLKDRKRKANARLAHVRKHLLRLRVT